MIQTPTSAATCNDLEPAPPTLNEGVVYEHLGKLETQLNQLRAQVRQAQQLSSLGLAASTIAHEVNNLLTPIRAYAQAALNTDDVELARKALTRTVQHVDMLVNMSQRVLEIGASIDPKPENTALRKVVECAVESLCRDLSKDGLELSLHIDHDLSVWVDPLQLRQVLFNLFLNARNAMAPSHGGRLTVRSERQDGRVIVEVSDNGPGIDAAMLPHVFEALTSSKTTDSQEPKRCSGLGLTLCHDLVEENGGTISVASQPGQGTTFTITLPASRPL